MGNDSIKTLAAVLFLSLVSFVFPIRASTITVPADYSTIQAAIDAANDGDEIIVADGTYIRDGNRDLDFEGKAVTLRSENGPNNCIIDCWGSQTEPHRGFYFHSTEDEKSVLDGFTITNGFVNLGVGGGIYCDNSSPTIMNCIFSGNMVGYHGGGIRCENSSPTIINCTFSGNSAGADSGGGMANSSSSPTIMNCTFIGNSSLWGGGLVNWRSNPMLINCTFSENMASEQGGGIYNWTESGPTLTNCTFTENTASLDGGGMYNEDSNSTLTNCILWSNTASNGNEIALYSSSTIDVRYCDVGGGQAGIYNDGTGTVNWGSGNIVADPCFVDAAGGSLRLKLDSPCIDAGDTTAFSLPLDMDGNPRAVDDPHTPNTGRSISYSLNVVDMGAYEFQPCRIPGDINCDGVVNYKDLAILCNNWLAGTDTE